MNRDDPFDDIFDEIERLMDEMMNDTGQIEPEESGFGMDIHVNVHETDEEIRVVADVPGIEQDDLSLMCDGEVLTIEVKTPDRETEERISLPGKVDEHSAAATFNNGILEVSFDRIDDSANISFE
ncbi:Hsp20/alpha crystallin family protein [Salinarchaeum sp. IM2453]|uniref:Hsp20/alpha crystallin family protein n=1 Tax=Salinarchaeum sp. IM2453 TaxID=2862870 RepID=UPI0021753B7B|nr:Hsp20/alpha crystallin family protein [Salinarchaeum sp. IM2453]